MPLSSLFKAKKTQTTPEVIRDPDKTDFCYFPFFEIMMSAEGKFKPCSKHYDFISHEGKTLVVGESSIEEAWNSDYMQTLRENFKNGVRMKGCDECWREQDMGLKPMRYDSYNYNIPESQVQQPLQPTRVEINASNICNLRCRICMPTASHKWIREAKELYNWEETVHFNMTPENMATIKSWIPNMMEIGLFGGEPLMSKENIELLEYCVETGHAKNIQLLLNTNGTVYDDHVAKLFKKFKHVFLNFSIDDIGPRFEYQRKNAKWDEVVENMKRWIRHGGYTEKDTIECKICCSVTNMNIFYFPEYFEFMNKEFPGLPVFWNLIYEPWEYSIEILPEEVKQIVRERLQSFVSTYEMTEKRTKTIDNLITYLNNTIDKPFTGFFEKIARHDRFRKEDFSETFPEFWDIIKDYAPERPALTK